MRAILRLVLLGIAFTLGMILIVHLSDIDSRPPSYPRGRRGRMSRDVAEEIKLDSITGPDDQDTLTQKRRYVIQVWIIDL